MTWQGWMTARRLLWEEQMGVHLRGRDNKKSSEYAESVARLKAAAAREEARKQES